MESQDHNDFLLQQLRDLHDGQKEILGEIKKQGEKVVRIETQIEPLFDNGQPGEITQLKSEIKDLHDTKKYALGFGAGLLFLEGGFHYLMHKLGIK